MRLIIGMCPRLCATGAILALVVDTSSPMNSLALMLRINQKYATTFYTHWTVQCSHF
jgi:hypothetical protein